MYRATPSFRPALPPTDMCRPRARLLEAALLAGTAALIITTPAIAATGPMWIAGGVLLWVGLFGIVSIIVMPTAPTAWPDLLLALLSATLGGLILASAGDQLGITLLLSGYLVAAGTAKLSVAYRRWQPRAPLWPWLVGSGFADLGAARLVLDDELPAAASLPLLAVTLLSGGVLLLAGLAQSPR